MDQPPPPESTFKTTTKKIKNMPIGSMTGVFTCMQTIKIQPSIPHGFGMGWWDVFFFCGGRSNLRATCILFWSQISRSLLDLLGNWSNFFPPKWFSWWFTIRESHRKNVRFYSGLQGGPLVDSCKWSYKFYKCWSYGRVNPMNGVIILLITW